MAALCILAACGRVGFVERDAAGYEDASFDAAPSADAYAPMDATDTGAAADTGASTDTSDVDAVVRPLDYPDTTGLVALWHFDESALADDDVVLDALGMHHGTLSTDDAAIKSVPGVLGNALRFDGTDDRVTIGAHPDFDKPAEGRKTFMGWVRRQGEFDHSTFITFNYGPTDQCFLPHFLDSDTLRYWDDLGGHASVSVGIPTDTWFHYATTIEGSRVRIYWDGVEVISATTASLTPLTATSVTLGWQNFDFYSHYDIDEVSVWNRVLSAAEIQTVYMSQR